MFRITAPVANPAVAERRMLAAVEYQLVFIPFRQRGINFLSVSRLHFQVDRAAVFCAGHTEYRLFQMPEGFRVVERFSRALDRFAKEV